MAHKVVHISTVHHPGDNRIFRKECLSLRDAGYDVHFVTRGSLDKPEGIKLHIIGNGQKFFDRIKAQSGLLEMLIGMNGDLYHFHDPELLPLASRLKKKTGKPIIYDKHESYLDRQGLQKAAMQLEKRYLPAMDRVMIAESSYRKELELVTDRVVDLFNYYKPGDSFPDPRSRSIQSDEKLKLIYTGFVAKQRGLDTMLALAEDLRDEGVDFELTIAGLCQIKKDRSWAEQEIARKDLAGHVRRVGWTEFVNHQEMESLLDESHIGLCLLDPLPNYLKSLPTKFYEYAHFGLPIVCSDFPLWNEYLDGNKCGLSISPRKEGRDLIEAISFIKQKTNFDQMSSVAIQSSKKHLWSDMAENLLNTYTDLLS